MGLSTAVNIPGDLAGLQCSYDIHARYTSKLAHEETEARNSARSAPQSSSPRGCRQTQTYDAIRIRPSDMLVAIAAHYTDWNRSQGSPSIA